MSIEKLKGAQARVRLKVRVPGSTANLGPGFDTFGLAVSLDADFEFVILEKPDEKIPFTCLTENTDPAWQVAGPFVERIMAEHFKSYAEVKDRLRVVIDSELPVGCGFGSSASTIVASLRASYELDHRMLSLSSLLVKGSELEGHSDNVGASVYGGFVVTGRSKKRPGVFAAAIKWPDQWCPLFVVPENAVSTAKARGILPKAVSRADAVWNIQHASLLVSAVANQDEELMREAMDDRLHEPYRYCLVPQLPVLKKLLKGTPALGCVLSGAGSSTMVLVNQRHKDEVKREIENWIKSAKTPPRLLDLKVDHLGSKVINGKSE
jgi:homoserine kinase